MKEEKRKEKEERLPDLLISIESPFAVLQHCHQLQERVELLRLSGATTSCIPCNGFVIVFVVFFFFDFDVCKFVDVHERENIKERKGKRRGKRKEKKGFSVVGLS